MWLDKLWEYKESISRPPVPDEAVAKVKDDINLKLNIPTPK